MKTILFFFLLIFICASAQEPRIESCHQSEKIYIQPEQVAFWEKQIWICLGPENWIPVQRISSDQMGFYASFYESDPDDLVPGTKKCWNCGATNSLRATTCKICGKQI